MALTLALAVHRLENATYAAAAQVVGAGGLHVRSVLGADALGRSTTRPYGGRRAHLRRATMKPRRSPGGWLDHPVLSLLLAATWLMLSRSLAPVHLISGAWWVWGAAPVAGPAARQQPDPLGPPAFRLTLVVIWDIVLSNITVAGWCPAPWNPLPPVVARAAGWPSTIGLDALFASIITMTPGTVSAWWTKTRCILGALD